ncbi:MAG TPA: hypothetical protein VJL32_03205 [Candidatus Paceibacterota bacterium]
MQTQYYCSRCKDFLTDNKLPNMNKRHQRCGTVLRVLHHEELAGKEDKEEE